jgi:peptidoglycan/xylan/chitin deacetylase (PgdA/CDA1 family)
MILMYHHVCPPEAMPVEQSELEGWRYTITPAAFETQLHLFKRKQLQFVSLSNYLLAMSSGNPAFFRMVTVTFDDGWRDNFDYAFPILQRQAIPATFFVVSGEMRDVAPARRMTCEHLRALMAAGMTIGAHTRTHPNLTMLNTRQLAREIHGCKADLEAILSASVDFLAYPGGRFNRDVVAACQAAGFHAACSVINWGQNSEESRFWLYREVFSDHLNRLSDLVRLNPIARRILARRAESRVRRMLASPASER